MNNGDKALDRGIVGPWQPDIVIGILVQQPAPEIPAPVILVVPTFKQQSSRPIKNPELVLRKAVRIGQYEYIVLPVPVGGDKIIRTRHCIRNN